MKRRTQRAGTGTSKGSGTYGRKMAAGNMMYGPTKHEYTHKRKNS